METKSFLITAAIIATIFTSCSKGDTGATGPTGPAGTNGTNGANGTNGTNGVANISSNIYSVTPGDWSSVGTDAYGVNITDASIANANTDGIEVFVSTNGTLWFGLPLNNFLVNGDEMVYEYQNGEIALGYFYSSAPTSTIDLKVVVIPPSIYVQYPNTNWNDYSQVSAIVQTEGMLKK